jgi:hypothetical protein
LWLDTVLGLAPQLRNLEVHFPGHGMQRALIAAGPGILPALASFATPCTAKPIRFGIEQCFEGFFNKQAQCRERFTDTAQNSKTIFTASRTGVALPTATNSPEALLPEHPGNPLYWIGL